MSNSTWQWDPQQVNYRPLESATERYIYTEDFRYNPKRPMHWLQRLCLWVLAKLGCHSVLDVYAYKPITFEPQTIVNELLRMDAHFFQTYHECGERLLLGPAEFAELSKTTLTSEGLRPLNFEVPYRFERTILHMPVTVIPWMNGMLILPKGFDRE